jgi:GTPase involved in cell partitioning and DNA repair
MWTTATAKIARITCEWGRGGETCTSRWRERERERKGERGGVDVVIRMFYDGKRGRMVWVEADYELWW